jgi:hypothetical protein
MPYFINEHRASFARVKEACRTNGDAIIPFNDNWK